jgi:hypothetical protein
VNIAISIDQFQMYGHAERFIEAGTTQRWPIPTPNEMEALWINAEDRDEHVGMLRGFLYELDFAPSTDLNCNPLAFRADSTGWRHWVAPCRNSRGQIIDLIAGPGADDDGWLCEGDSTEHYATTGCGAIIGADELAKSWSAADPMPVFYSLNDWLEENLGVLVLKRKARELLRLAAHVRLNNWYDAADLADEWFEDDRERVSGPQDRIAYEGYLARRAQEELQSEQDAASWARFNAKLARQDAARAEGVIRRRPSKWTAAAKVQRKTQLLGSAL